MRIDLYSDKSDQVFSALQRVGRVHLPTIASVVLSNFPIRLGEDFLSFPRPAPQAPRNRNGPAPINVVERANGASCDGIVRLPFIPDLDVQEERKPPTSCASAIALYSIPFDTAAGGAILASGCLLSVVFLWAPTCSLRGGATR